MKAIVTGAAGFIGSHVAEHLATSGINVLGLDDLSGSSIDNIPANVDFIEFDCQNSMVDLFKKFRPDYVYHLAAYAAEGLSHHIPTFNYQNNLIATANAVTASLLSGAKHFVFTSSIATYGHPDSSKGFSESTPCNPCDPYGIAKYACELHIKCNYDFHRSLPFTIFRPHNVFGPRQNISDPYRNVVGIFMRSLMEGRPMPIFGDGSQTRSFSYIDVVAKAIAFSPTNALARNETFNVGGDEKLSVSELANRVAKAMGKPAIVEHLPPRNEVAHAHCDHTKVRSVFSDLYLNEIGIDEGLKLMADFVKRSSIPPVTECPSEIEIMEGIPSAWRQRLVGQSSQI